MSKAKTEEYRLKLEALADKLREVAGPNEDYGDLLQDIETLHDASLYMGEVQRQLDVVSEAGDSGVRLWPARKFRMTLVVDADTVDGISEGLRSFARNPVEALALGASACSKFRYRYEVLRDPDESHNAEFSAARVAMAPHSGQPAGA